MKDMPVGVQEFADRWVAAAQMHIGQDTEFKRQLTDLIKEHENTLLKKWMRALKELYYYAA